MDQLLKLSLVHKHRGGLLQSIQLPQQNLIVVLIKLGEHHLCKLLPFNNPSSPLHGLKPGCRGPLEIEHGEPCLHRLFDDVDVEIQLALFTPETPVRSIKFGKIHLRKRRGTMRGFIRGMDQQVMNQGVPLVLRGGSAQRRLLPTPCPMGNSTHGGVVLDEAPGAMLRLIPAACGCGGGGGSRNCQWTGGGGGGGGR